METLIFYTLYMNRLQVAKVKHVKKLKDFRGYEVHCCSYAGKKTQLMFFINQVIAFDVFNDTTLLNTLYVWDNKPSAAIQQKIFDKISEDFFNQRQKAEMKFTDFMKMRDAA